MRIQSKSYLQQDNTEEELLYSVVLYYPAKATMNFQSCSLYGTHGIMQTITTMT